jgi:hypothetical protein
MNMRSSLAIAILVAFLGSTVPVRAQTYPMKLTIVGSKVEVRSGPTDKYYVTGNLYQGESVSVMRPAKEPGWLEIEPPTGSFTWINAKYVKQIDAYKGVVVDDDSKFVAPALIGSAEFKGKPTVEAKPGFLAGTIVCIVNPPLTVDGETWLPVRPDLREVRYIPANAVNLPATTTVTAPASWAIGSKSTNPPPAAIPGYPGGNDVKPVNGNTTSFSPSPAPPAASIPGPGTPAQPAAQTFPAEWSQYGTLQSTAFTKDGQPMYVLVNAQGQTIMYVTSKSGTSLRGYVNRTVSLYGPRVYRPDPYITAPYMVASHVAVP